MKELIGLVNQAFLVSAAVSVLAITVIMAARMYRLCAALEDCACAQAAALTRDHQQAHRLPIVVSVLTIGAAAIALDIGVCLAITSWFARQARDPFAELNLVLWVASALYGSAVVTLGGLSVMLAVKETRAALPQRELINPVTPNL